MANTTFPIPYSSLNIILKAISLLLIVPTFFKSLHYRDSSLTFLVLIKFFQSLYLEFNNSFDNPTFFTPRHHMHFSIVLINIMSFPFLTYLIFHLVVSPIFFYVFSFTAYFFTSPPLCNSPFTNLLFFLSFPFNALMHLLFI